MKINSKVALTVVLAGFLALGQGSLFAKSHEHQGKEAGKKVDQAEAATKEKAKEVVEATEAKAEEVAEKAKEKVKEVKEKAAEAVKKS